MPGLKAAGIKRVDINQAECDRLLRAPGGAVHNRVTQYGRKTEILAKANAPSDTGEGAASITSDTSVRGKKVKCVIGTPLRYMLYQHQGTGPIYPRRKKALRFKPKGEQYFVFAKKTKGVPSTPFLVEALREACPWPPREDAS